MTNDIINVRTINGTLTLTAVREKYFDGEYTSSTIISRQSFEWKSSGSNTKLLIQFRAAFATDLGIFPRIILTQNHRRYNFITVLSYENKRLWKRFKTQKNDNEQNKLLNGTYQTDLNQFQNYEFEILAGQYKWRLNGKEYLSTNESELISENYPPNWRLVITVHVDRQHELELGCSSLIIDYIRVYQDDLTRNHFGDIAKILPNIEQICDAIKTNYQTQRNMEFVPDQSLKPVWKDEFSGNKLNESLWLVLGSRDECQSESNFENIYDGFH